jgi:hypothetical protein
MLSFETTAVEVKESEITSNASITLPDHATVKIMDASNDDHFDMASLLLIGKDKAFEVRPSIKTEIAKEVEMVIKLSDALIIKNQKYHDDYVIRGTQALYGVLTDIYALALKIENSTARDHILKEMRKKLGERDIKTQYNTPAMTVVIKYVVGAERQTAANYSRVLNIAMQEDVTPNELASYISRRGGIGQIHAIESDDAAKKLGAKQSKERLHVIQEMFQLLGHSSDYSFNYDLNVTQLNADKQNGAETGRFVTFLTVFDENEGVYKIVNGFDLGQTYEDSLVKLLSKDITNDLDGLKRKLKSFKQHLIDTKKVHQGWINRFNREFEAEDQSSEKEDVLEKATS